MHIILFVGLFVGIFLTASGNVPGISDAAFAAEPASTDITNSSTDKAPSLRTRFLIGVPKNTKFHVQSLRSPNRVVVHLPDIKINLPPQPSNGPVGLVRSFSAGKAGAKRSLVVINVTRPVVVSSAELMPNGDGAGRFLTLDIDPAEQDAPEPTSSTALATEKFGKPFGLGAAGLQPPTPSAAQTPTERAAKMAKRTIVIDPGHGGDDSGAKKNGVVEKNVVLAFSHILREMLEKTGRYNVLMTRSTDKFISLGGRVDFAEKHKAHLFLAVHADYARSKARGATVYSLRDSVARSLERSTKRRAGKIIDISGDNFAASPSVGGDRSVVRGFLADLARNDVEITRERTKSVSQSIVSFMGGSTNLRHDPHKTAAFRVLKTAQFPSVLIELAYVTNKRDARNLTSDKWRKKVARSLVTAVDDYFTSEIANMPM